MIFLLDTNVVSEMTRKHPDAKVLSWFDRVSSDHVRVSVLTLGELGRGIQKLPEGKRQTDLLLWFDTLLEDFRYQTLPVDSLITLRWGVLSAESERIGRPLPVIDGLIAATAYVHGAILVTRNTADFEFLPIQVLNPWQ